MKRGQSEGLDRIYIVKRTTKLVGCSIGVFDGKSVSLPKTNTSLDLSSKSIIAISRMPVLGGRDERSHNHININDYNYINTIINL